MNERNEERDKQHRNNNTEYECAPCIHRNGMKCGCLLLWLRRSFISALKIMALLLT